MKLTIRPLRPDLWPAFEGLLGESGAAGGCWCMYWRIGGVVRKRPRESNKAAFRAIRGGQEKLHLEPSEVVTGACLRDWP